MKPPPVASTHASDPQPVPARRATPHPQTGGMGPVLPTVSTSSI
jgi:hypothetical protein